MILAADIGGTNTRLLLAEVTGQGWRSKREQDFASADFPSFEAVLQQFLLPGERVQAACFAVAGPVINQRVSITHLPWELDATVLSRQLAIPRVVLVNDFVAQALGLPLLTPVDYQVLQQGEQETDGACLLVGAGTGLGIATRVGCGQQHAVVASEGGHADFGPHGQEQVALHAMLLARDGYVSLESVLSGRGLENCYTFCASRAGQSRSRSLRAADVTAAATAGDAVALAAMALFLEIYGSTAGNLALINLPHGGVYITGGIAAKIAPFFQDSRFMAAFCDKPPKQELLGKVPVYLVVNDRLGLLGAVAQALSIAGLNA